MTDLIKKLTIPSVCGIVFGAGYQINRIDNLYGLINTAYAEEQYNKNIIQK